MICFQASSILITYRLKSRGLTSDSDLEDSELKNSFASALVFVACFFSVIGSKAGEAICNVLKAMVMGT